VRPAVPGSAIRTYQASHVTLHIRLISPPEMTRSVIAAVASVPGVSDLLLLPGAGRPGGGTVQPGGDAVQFDVTASAASDALARLRELGADRPGPIAIQSVDAVIGTAAPTRRQRVLERDVPPVWDLIEARIRRDAVYAPSFYLLLLCAGLIAATGILTNNQVLIVGAMVVGPEYSAIIAIALGIDRGERRPVTTGLLALLAGFSAAIAACLLYGLCVRGLGRTPHYYAIGLRPVSDLINSPDLFSVIVAVLAGAVGVISLTEARGGALIGVFISVTTIPAAADIGLSVAYTSWHRAAGSLLQLSLNVVLLIVVGTGCLRLQRWHWRRRERGARSTLA